MCLLFIVKSKIVVIAIQLNWQDPNVTVKLVKKLANHTIQWVTNFSSTIGKPTVRKVHNASCVTFPLPFSSHHPVRTG